MPYYTKPLLSMWPKNLSFTFGKLQTLVPPEILNMVKMVDFVGYAPNPKTFRRNQCFKPQIKLRKEPKFRSEQEWEIMKSGENKNSNVCSTLNLGHRYRFFRKYINRSWDSKSLQKCGNQV
jgi:PAB-dependent poly(A)-specific ribonuclease subunit 2